MWLRENFEKFGSFFKQSLFFGKTIFVVSDADVAKRIMTEPKSFYRNNAFQEAVKDIFPHALFVIPSGEEWKRHRKMLQPSFAPSHLQHALQVSQKFAKKLSDFIENQIKKNMFIELDPLDTFNHLALDVM